MSLTNVGPKHNLTPFFAFYLLKLSCFFLLLGLTSLSLALPKDKYEKLYVTADSVIYNYHTGEDIFKGHVIVNQGSSHINADELITKKNKDHQIEEAIAYGIDQLAHYWTLPAAQDPEIHAHAKIIKFYPLASHLSLHENVTVKQGENSFQGQSIFYNMKTQVITVPSSQQGRATLVYNPQK